MSDSLAYLNLDVSHSSSLYNVLKTCANLQSNESLYNNDDNVNNLDNTICTFNNYKIFDDLKMISMNSHSMSGYISSSTSYASDESFGDGILEEDAGRISLAYENLRTIPRSIAEKFAAKTKFLDLSYNHFHNLSFLSFFEELHTLILDRNSQLKYNTLPFMGNLKILWINNCEITNIKEWIQRIQMQCPILEHLSIMGNPGITNQFEYCTFTHQSDINCITPITVTANYLEYILHVLPGLLYLNGIAREKFLKYEQSIESITSRSSSTQQSSNESNNNNNHNNNNKNNNVNRKKSPTLSFKELFQLKRRKKSYQSSSTN